MSLKGKVILVVDDEQTLRETLVDYFELQGAILLEASNGNEAYEIILKEKIDLILSDVRMPECSGIDLLNKIRSSKAKTPPIIMMSAFTEYSESDILNLGAKAMFIKPGTMSQLKELMTDAINN